MEHDVAADPDAKPPARLVAVELDEASIARGSADVEHERATAIWDLVEDNRFAPVGHDGGPYRLKLGLVDNRLAFAITTETGEAVAVHLLSLTPFRRIVKDYFFVCDSYFAAIRTASPSKIEAIDMGRRGLHNDGSQVLVDRLAGKIDIDFDTARRLFTLICALRWKG
ncbi:UPF0262 family protein [Siculibacillus lacustris]|uniref:UPF0262 protein EYW49_08875 n=1 Tax=Siculibacillus lacustris TaxID=1549641 RepID=A0A4Q9VUK2_9HYPH|nr:UPF0262 family protein [Siculibacillus lacustris]TBW38823.1 UPF0262 family protein [Siculibacillus lacustris]